MKYINIFILLCLLLTGVIYKDKIEISTNLFSIIADKNISNKLNIATNLGYSKEIFIAIEGFDSNSKKKVQEIATQLAQIQGIKNIVYTTAPSEDIIEYYKKNYAILADFNSSILSDKEIDKRVALLHDSLLKSVLYTVVNKDDPLGLFSLKKNIPKNKFIELIGHGYLIKAGTKVALSDIAEAKLLYKKVKILVDSYSGVKAFAPFFYSVENSRKIKNDTKYIALFSVLILAFIYYLLLKDIKLLLYTYIALASSMIFAIFATVLSLGSIHVIALVFGMAITGISIDYLLHYHVHNFYHNKSKIDKNVLFGFLTTIFAFGLLFFTPIGIISQISLYCIVSLSFAYLLFTYVFPFLEIKKYRAKISHVKRGQIPAYFFTIISLMLLVYSLNSLHFDNNLRDLDYQNSKLKKIEFFFKNSIQSNLTPVLVEAKTKESLIANLHKIKKQDFDSISFANFIPEKKKCMKKNQSLRNYDFTDLNRNINSKATEVGFKKGYFSNSYEFTKNMKCNDYNFKAFKDYSLDIYFKNNKYYTLAFVSKLKTVEQFEFVQGLLIDDIFRSILKNAHEYLLIFLLLVATCIIIMLFFIAKKRFLYALNYILFPSSFVLFFISLFYKLNIMHIFAIIILIAIGIDFGIYMSRSKKIDLTIISINYSLMSTFGAFGVLIFSSILALNSIGVVISVGVISIYILMRSMK